MKQKIRTNKVWVAYKEVVLALRLLLVAVFFVGANKDFSKPQQDKARQFIDAGADIVLGGHPHVTQSMEIYKNKPIFYSLGNFVFDQVSYDKVQQGLAVGTVFNKDKLEFYIFPMQNKNFQVNFADKENRDIILKWLSDKAVASDNIKKQIISGKIIINIH